MKKYIAEFFGTFCLLFVGISSIVLGGFGATMPLGILGIAMAFGLTVAAMVYTIGPVSGCHLNPAVTIGVYLAGRMDKKDVLPYMAAQVAGAIVGAFAVFIIVQGKAGGYSISEFGLGQNGWDPVNGYSVWAAFLVEVIATFIFVAVILGLTHPKQETIFAGLIIGTTLLILHIAFIPVSGNSVNPARSLGPALFAGSAAIGQMWLYIIAPMIGGALAGYAAKANLFYTEE